MEMSTLIAQHRERLTPAERRVAEMVLSDPQGVAFGTVATLAGRSGTSDATVIRLAGKLGFDGFGPLQARVQKDLADRLRPAHQRIREPSPSDVVSQALAMEVDNLHATLEGVDRQAFARASDRIARGPGRVFLVAGEWARCVADLIADELAMLRDGVVLVDGNDVRVGRILGAVSDQDTVLAIDNRRYDQWLLRVVRVARDAGAYVVSFSDSPLSPLSEVARVHFTISARGLGPFDSQVAALALGHALVASVATRLAPRAASRLDRVEASWSQLGALSD